MDAVLFACLCLIWGSTWVAIKIGLDGVPPFLAAGLRFLLAAVIIGIVVAIRRTPIRLTRNDRVCILSAGFLLFWLDYAGVYWAEGRISSGLTAVLFSTMPLVTALLSAYWTRTERLRRRMLLGILAGVAGTALMFWPGEPLRGSQILGMMAALAGAFCASANLVTVKKYGHQTDLWILNLGGMAIGCACLLMMSAIFEPWTSVVWTQRNVLAIVYLSVFGSVIAFSVYYHLVRQMDATVLSLTTLVIPIVALVLGHEVLKEPIGPTEVIATGIILAGVAIALVPSSPSPQAPAGAREPS